MLEWVERFNHRGLFETIVDMIAAEQEEEYCQNQERARVG